MDHLLDQPTHAVNHITVAHGYGRQANCPVCACLHVKEPQQLAPMTRHGSLHWLWHDSRMQTSKQGT
jgi:hypothetical protein